MRKVNDPTATDSDWLANLFLFCLLNVLHRYVLQLLLMNNATSITTSGAILNAHTYFVSACNI